ncbi:hypothetical protein P9269_21205, partial [Bacillus licheniformis]|nr:hypothetical protein [Bacillus licheniformis]
MYKLTKSHEVTPNSNLFSILDRNATLTENALNQNASNLKKHKKAKNAHTSDQITHFDGLTVSDEIERAKKRINNLILNADGS